jgi:hypothetical protein
VLFKNVIKQKNREPLALVGFFAISSILSTPYPKLTKTS